jgi:hypothetical protein
VRAAESGADLVPHIESLTRQFGFDSFTYTAMVTLEKFGWGSWFFSLAGFGIIGGCLIIGTIAIAMDRWLLLPIEHRTVERWGLVIDATKEQP